MGADSGQLGPADGRETAPAANAPGHSGGALARVKAFVLDPAPRGWARMGLWALLAVVVLIAIPALLRRSSFSAAPAFWIKRGPTGEWVRADAASGNGTYVCGFVDIETSEIGVLTAQAYVWQTPPPSAVDVIAPAQLAEVVESDIRQVLSAAGARSLLEPDAFASGGVAGRNTHVALVA